MEKQQTTTLGQQQRQTASDFLRESASTTAQPKLARTRPAESTSEPEVVHHPPVRRKADVVAAAAANNKPPPPKLIVPQTVYEDDEEEDQVVPYGEQEEALPPPAAPLLEALPLPPFPTPVPKKAPAKRERETASIEQPSEKLTLTRQTTSKFAQGTNAPAMSVQPSAITASDMTRLPDEHAIPLGEIGEDEWEEILEPILGELELAGEHMETIYPVTTVPGGYRLRVTGLKWSLEQENPKKKGWWTARMYCQTDIKRAPEKPRKIKSFYKVEDKDKKKK